MSDRENSSRLGTQTLGQVLCEGLPTMLCLLLSSKGCLPPVEEMGSWRSPGHPAVQPGARSGVCADTRAQALTPWAGRVPSGGHACLAMPGGLCRAVVRVHLQLVTGILPGAQGRFLAGREACLSGTDRASSPPCQVGLPGKYRVPS